MAALQTVENPPVFNLIEQENFMKDHILLYFENQELNE